MLFVAYDRGLNLFLIYKGCLGNMRIFKFSYFQIKICMTLNYSWLTVAVHRTWVTYVPRPLHTFFILTGFCWAAFKVIFSVVIGSHGSSSQTDNSGTPKGEHCGRRDVASVVAINCGASGPGLNTLLTQCISPPRCING